MDFWDVDVALKREVKCKQGAGLGKLINWRITE